MVELQGNNMEIALLILAGVLAIAGLLGSVVPILPGAPLNFIGIVILYFVKDEGVVSLTALIIFGVLTLIAIVIDYVLPIAKAKAFGASKYGIWGSIIGMIVGLLAFSFIGMVVGTFLGAVIGELINRKKMGQAMTAGAATFLGTFLAMIVKLVISSVMTVYFFIKVFS